MTYKIKVIREDKKGKNIHEVKAKIILYNKILTQIDFSNTSASCYFAEVKFKDDDKTYIINLTKIPIKELNKLK
jgi:hypothetical protein